MSNRSILPVGKQELKGDHYVSKPQTHCLRGNRHTASATASPSRRKTKTLLATCIVYRYSFKLLALSLGSTTPKVSYKRRHQLLLKTSPRTNSSMGRSIRKQPYSLPHTGGTARDLQHVLRELSVYLLTLNMVLTVSFPLLKVGYNSLFYPSR